MTSIRSVAALACVIACAGCAWQSIESPPHRSYWQGKQAYEDLFDSSVAKRTKAIDEPIVGAILPHHLFVGHEIAAAYNALRSQKPSVVVIIGPNHFSKGRGIIQTTDRAFDTPYGTLKPATDIIRALESKRIATIEPATMDGEHAVSTHVAFVKKMFPKATVVPIAIAIGAPIEPIDALAETLDAVLPEDALVIASVDFSHYMRREVAEFHDAYSRAAIERFSLDDVAQLEIDSPESIRSLLLYLAKRDSQKIVYKRHTNSADFTAVEGPEETTSHFFMTFGKGERMGGPFGTVQFFGDTIVARGIEEALAQAKDPLSAIRGTEHRFFRGATVTVANLEGPITDAPVVGNKLVSFAFDREHTIAVLHDMGVRVASIANNHIDDAGARGRDDTVAVLRDAGIATAGYPEPCATVRIIGGTMAVCAFADMNGLLDLDAAAATIANLRGADYVVASVHWGIEYANEPNERQRTVAKALLAAGASAVVGHGPHVAQPLEWIDGKPVFYSIGNFLFDQPDPTLSSGIVAGITLAPTGIGATSFPIETINGVPHHSVKQ